MLNSSGYVAVGGLLFLEDFGVPVPGETILIAAAAVYAGAGSLTIALVVGVGVLAAGAGDNVGVAIGHFGGRRLVKRFGRYVLLTPARLATAELFFTRHGGKPIVVPRIVEGLRQRDHRRAHRHGWRRFLGFNTVGAVLWVGVWTTLGYLTGTDMGPIYEQISRYQLHILTAVAVLIAAFVLWRLLHGRHRPPCHPGRPDSTGVNP